MRLESGASGRGKTVSGRSLAIAEGWSRGPQSEPIEDPTALGPVVRDLLSKARANAGMDDEPGHWPQNQ
jgi:hypothetical protein